MKVYTRVPAWLCHSKGLSATKGRMLLPMLLMLMGVISTTRKVKMQLLTVVTAVARVHNARSANLAGRASVRKNLNRNSMTIATIPVLLLPFATIPASTAMQAH